MQYFIRAVKYFFYFAILTTLILSVLVIIGAVEGNIESMFSDGYNAIWKMAIFFILVAAVYPKFGFINRRLYVDGDWDTLKNTALTYMAERRYILVSENGDEVTFRCKDIASRISKMYEDTVVLKKTEDGYFLEGLRKDVIRLAAGLEHRLTQH